MTKKSFITGLAAAAAVALVLTGCSSQTGGSEQSSEGKPEVEKLTLLRIGIMSDATLDIAEEQGFFADEGIELDIQTVANPPAGLAAIQGGQADIAFSTSTVFVNALAQSIPVVAIAPAAGYPEGMDEESEEFAEYDDAGLYADPARGITSVADLEGEIIALGGARNGQLEIVTTWELQQEGIAADQVEWVSLDLNSALEAVVSGNAAAAMLVKPFTVRAEDAGLVRIDGPQGRFFGTDPFTFWLTGSATAENKAEAIEGFQRAILRANAWANEHRDEALQMGIEAAGLDVPLERAGLVYWPTSMDVEGFERKAESMRDLGFLTADVDFTNAVLPLPAAE